MSKLEQQTPSYKNILPNTYVPYLGHKVLYNILDRLSKNSILQFIILWTKLKNTQPKPPSKYTQHGFNKKITKEVSEFRKSINRTPKRKLIDKIIFEYWTQGLNLLQISQIDCQLIVDKSNSAQSWIYSTVKDMHDKIVPISINPREFLNNLVKNLSSLYLSYIYICKHPKLPIILIRIQVFDLNGMDITEKPHIISHKAYFFGIFVNSPHVVHSINNDAMVHGIVMEAFERSLPQSKNNLLKLITPEDQFPVKSIQSMHILKGCNRSGNSLGIWTPYADGTVDMLPLGAIEDHQVFKSEAEIDEETNETEDVDNLKLQRLKKIANLRFKGSLTGNKQSSSEEPNHHQQQQQPEQDSNLDQTEREGQTNDTEFDSIAPIQYAEFILKEKTIATRTEKSIGDDGRTNIKFKITGSDVFGGLHELSVKSTEPEEIILNPEEVPNWLTGEEGASIGEIRNGNFYNKING